MDDHLVLVKVKMIGVTFLFSQGFTLALPGYRGGFQ